jgi:7-cyano-7-deazaguanine synthase
VTAEIATVPLSRIAVLISGGLDSAILLAEAVHTYGAVHPLYVRNGFTWESAEQEHLDRFLARLTGPSLRPLCTLELPLDELLPDHWSVTGLNVPDATSPDEAVFLPGRNVLLLSKALLFCHLNGVPTIALATLGGNPFADATPEFFRSYQDAVNLALGGSVEIVRPYGMLSKVEVMERGRGLPLELTFSCIRPVHGRHCGVCNKCAERRLAFANARMDDLTEYQLASSAHS